MIGHKEIQKDFKKLVERGRLGHAYLFFGPEGVGKSHFGRCLASFLESGEWEADPLRPLSDILVIGEIERTIGIDESRRVRQFLSERPIVSSRRTVIISRAELLTTEAQNALLKIAEEPPASALLILAVPDPEALMPTLVSRFQKIYFGTLGEKEMEEGLQEAGHAGAEVKRIIKAVKGKPGWAFRSLKEEEEPELVAGAREFLRATPSERKDLLKAITSPEDFNFRSFLDALIRVMAEEDVSNIKLWHSVLELRSIADSTGLSPSIQLRNLWTLI